MGADWLLIGGDSEIGAATFDYLRGSGRRVAATTRRADRSGPDRPLLDLGRPIEDWQPPTGTRAACIFAAVARLAACADDPVRSSFVNVTQTVRLVERLASQGIYVVFLSTNQVFDGSRPRMPPTAAHCPVSEYGRQKAATEAALTALMDKGAPVAILRLAKIVSRDTPLLKEWQNSLSSGRPVRAFHDMVMAPTPVHLVARAIEALLEDRPPGIWQMTGPEDISYAQAAAHLARRAGADPALVVAVSAASAGLPPGATPRHTTLDSAALEQRFRIGIPGPWPVLDWIFDG